MIDLRNNIKGIKKAIETPLMGLSTGIATLDKMICGLSPGQLVTVAGRPSMGKSSLARDILLATGNPKLCDGVSILFSLEMAEDEIIELLVANVGQLDYQEYKYNIQNPEFYPTIDKACSKLADYNIMIEGNPKLTPDNIREVVKDVSLDDKVSCIIVDYLQLMSLRKLIESRTTEVGEISRELKVIALEFGIPVVALSQLNRNVEYRESTRPRMADLRESGSIENDSDKIILIHRPSYYITQQDSNAEDNGEAELIICKNRKLPTGIIKCGWVGSWMSFRDIPEDF